MERHIAKTSDNAASAQTAVQAQTADLLTDKHADYGRKNSAAAMHHLPNQDELLAELNKDAKAAKENPKNGLREQIIANENVYHLKDAISHLKPEDLKLIGDTAAAIQKEIANGKTPNPEKYIDELAKASHTGPEHARTLWNATMLELAREKHTNVELVKHSRWYQDPNSFIHDPFTHVYLTDSSLYK